MAYPSASLGQATVVFDGSLGEPGPAPTEALPGGGVDYRIEHSRGQTVGTSLFHSFSELGINTGDAATFTGPDRIDHVFGRVTGGNASYINGLLRSEIASADLYLLNPSGVMFGPDATLDVKGSFHVSTAHELHFESGTWTTERATPGVPLLAVKPAPSFGFLGSGAAITLQGELAVPEGETLSLIGSGLEISGGSLTAPGGRINLASVASSGTVGLGSLDDPEPLDVGSFTKLGAIDLAAALVDVSGDPPGSIFMRGGQLAVEGSDVLAVNLGDGSGGRISVSASDSIVASDGARIDAGTVAGGPGGAIDLEAPSVEITNGAGVHASSSGASGAAGTIHVDAGELVLAGGEAGAASIKAGSFEGSSGTGGFIHIDAERVELRGITPGLGPAFVSVASTGGSSGNAGTVQVNAESIEISGIAAFISAHSSGGSTGNAGTVRVEAGSVDISSSATGLNTPATGGSGLFAHTEGSGLGGLVEIAVDQLVLRDGAFIGVHSVGSQTTGHAGEVQITGRSVDIVGGGVITATSLAGSHGDAGTVRIRADDVRLRGILPRGGGIGAGSVFGSDQGKAGPGNAGTIEIIAGSLEVTHGAFITVHTEGPGDGGTIDVTAESVVVDGTGAPQHLTGIYNTTDGEGDAGTIDIAADSVTLAGGGIILAQTSGSGDAGRIWIEADGLTVVGNSTAETPYTWISANVAGDDFPLGPGSGNAGTIDIITGSLELENGGISVATGATGGGRAGTVDIKADSVEMSRNSVLTAQTSGVHDGGTVAVTADSVEIRGGSRIDALTGGAGDGGTVAVTADSVEIRGGSGINVMTVGAGDAGSVKILAGSVLVDGWDQNVAVPDWPDRSGIWAHPWVVMGGTGGGGSVDITAQSLRLSSKGSMAVTSGTARFDVGEFTMSSGAQIWAGGFGAHQPGSVELTATESVLLTNEGGPRMILGQDFVDNPVTFISTAHKPDRFTGEITPTSGGSIVISAPEITVTEGALISAEVSGPGGTGLVDLTADRITVSSGGMVSGSGRALGAGGDVVMSASDSIVVEGRSEFGDPAAVSSHTLGEGPAGEVSLSAPTIEVDDGIINSASLPPRDADDPARGGAAGAISIEAGRLVVRNGGRIDTSTLTDGAGGSIDVDASKSISIEGAGSAISSMTAAGGDGGAVRLSAPRTEVVDGGAVSAGSRPGLGGLGALFVNLGIDAEELGAQLPAQADGAAGLVRIEAKDKLELRGGLISSEAETAFGGGVEIEAGSLVYLLDGTITASSGAQDGGNVSIDPEFVVLNHGEITANAEGARGGDGGNIDVAAEYVFASADSVITASSAAGVQGTVVIRSPDIDLSGDLASLPESYVDAAALLKGSCAARVDGREGSLIIEGREGLPTSPDHPRSARYKDPALSASDSPLLRAAESAERRGDFEAAIGSWREAAKSLDVRLRLAQAYESVGDLGRALELLEQGGARSLGVRGRVLARAGATKQALGAFDEAAGLAPSDSRLLAQLQLDRGNVLFSAERWDEVKASYVEAERLLSKAEVNDSPLHAMLQTNRATLAIDTERPDVATSLLDRAVKRLMALPDGHDKAFTLLSVGRGYQRLGNQLRAAEIYGQAGEIAEQIEDARSASYAWGYLGGLYEEKARVAEALELTGRALLAAERADAPAALYLWQWQAGRLYQADTQVDAAISVYRAAARTLRELRLRAALRDRQQQAFARELPTEPVVTGLVDVLLQRASFTEDRSSREALLGEVRNTLEEFKATELQDYFQDECVAALQHATPESIPGAVVVYPVLLPDRTELLMSLPGGLESIYVPVGADELTREIHRFRHLLEKRTTNEYLRPAERLYDWLIRPLEQRLEAADVQVLVFVPGGPLRGVPMAALLDKKTDQFLIQKYALAVVPGLTLTDPRHIDTRATETLRAGLTQGVQGYAALPFVASEIAVLEELSPGTTLLDAEFQASALEHELTSAPFGIVHIASHGEFGGDPEGTYVLTFDEKLRMAELAELVGVTEFRDEPLELLTLSACVTAAGDDRSALGLAGVAVKAGARSTLATLWYIDDRASSQLVTDFYRQLAEPEVSRAAALQRAQVALLSDPSYRHPAYWSPFLLIGSWL